MDASKAFQVGLKDGAEQVRDLTSGIGQAPLSGEALVEKVESWFSPGTLGPDEAFINALGSAEAGKALGLTEEQVEERGDAWSKALDDYSRGYRAGARRAAKDEDSAENDGAKVKRAAAHVEAVDVGDGNWAHYAQEVGRWYVVSEGDLETLADLLDDGEGDAYSRWCSDDPGECMPRDWSPGDEIPVSVTAEGGWRRAEGL